MNDQIGAQSASSLMPWLVGLGALALFYALVRPALDRRRWRVAADLSPGGLLMGALGLYVLLIFFPPILAPAILFAIVVHEYGHVLAYRLTGHRNPIFRLMPFGGVAISDQPHQSHSASFFVSVMGPGFSIVLIVVCMLAAEFLAPQSPLAAGYAYNAAVLIGLLNAANMLPFYPLDGGQALRALASVFGRAAMRGAALAMNAALAAAAIALQFWILLILAVIGLLSLSRANAQDETLPPMRVDHALLCLAVYAAIMSALIWPGRFLIEAYWLAYTSR